MTEREYRQNLKALRDYSKVLLADKKKLKRHLKKIGLWDLLVPNDSAKPARPAPRKK